MSPSESPALQSVARVALVLEAVAQEPATASQIVERLGLKWATAHRALSQLHQSGFLVKDASDGTYSIGPRLYTLGKAYLRDHPLVAAGAPETRALAHQLSAPVQLNERQGLVTAVLVATDPSPTLIPKTTVEFDFSLNAGSNGHVLLAYSPPDVLAQLSKSPLPSYTAHTITDPDRLARALEQVRAQGFAVTHDDILVGTGSVAAPVFDGPGQLRGATCAVVPTSQLEEPRISELISAVSAVANSISGRLGWRTGRAPAVLSRWPAARGG
jgi:DNA-binding IclR family transcriptional regulator